MIGSPDSGKKPAVRNVRSDGHGGEVVGTDNEVPIVRGHGHFKAPEKSTKPVVPDFGPSANGWHRGEDHAADPTIP